jgi:6-phosphogluconolactonase
VETAGAVTDLRVLPSAEDVAHAAARFFADRAKREAAGGARFTVALSGGQTPTLLYQLLARQGTGDSGDSIPWSRVQVFWCDERHVPPTHADSNYRMAAEALLDHVPIPSTQIHRIHTEDPSAEAAALDYERTIRQAFGLGEGQCPVFDLILLGMGTDGHTASLFPGSPAIDETARLVVAPRVAQAATGRITMTPPVLTSAAATLVLVTGTEKAATLQAVVEGPNDPSRYPIQCLRMSRNPVTWMIDRAAASRLSGQHA